MSIKLSSIINEKISDDKTFQKAVKLTTVIYEPNEKILTNLVKYPYFCLIKRGAARVKIRDSKGSSIATVVAELVQDDVFGEFGLFDDTPASADIVATVQTEILQIDNESFLEFLKRDSIFCYAFSIKIMQDLFQRIKDDNKKITTLMNFNLQLQKKPSAEGE